jgi:regulator of RNase E activity RraA
MAMFKNFGSPGLVTEGFIRDLDEVTELEYGVVARGTSPTNARGRVARVSIGEPIVIGGVQTHSGDWIAADADGVVVIPRELVGSARLLDWLRHADDKERQATAMLRAGERLSAVFARFGQL